MKDFFICTTILLFHITYHDRLRLKRQGSINNSQNQWRCVCVCVWHCCFICIFRLSSGCNYLLSAGLLHICNAIGAIYMSNDFSLIMWHIQEDVVSWETKKFSKAKVSSLLACKQLSVNQPVWISLEPQGRNNY